LLGIVCGRLIFIVSKRAPLGRQGSKSIAGFFLHRFQCEELARSGAFEAVLRRVHFPSQQSLGFWAHLQRPQSK
jgi:hypothetical protein